MVKEALSEEYLPLLKKFGLEGLDPAGLHLVRYNKGEYLCHEGAKVEYFQIITTGRVKISVSNAAGKILLFCFDVAGDMLGSIELMSGLDFTATGQAVTETHCISVPTAPNMEYFRTSLGFLNYLCTDLSHAFARSSKNNAMNILHPLQTRLSSYIVMTEEDGMFTDKLTEVSELLGTSYRHLHRSLDGLCKEGILEKQKQGYKIKKPKQLEALAEDYYSF